MTASKSPSAPIGIFDSGLGGLTVFKSLEQQLPDESFIYFGDTAHVPYGSKSKETVRMYSERITKFLIEQEVKLVVVACNTASSVALDYLKDRFAAPIIGVVEPAVEKAIANTRSGTIGVIGTRATITSNSYLLRIQEQAPDVEVLSRACPLFVSLVEEGWENTPVATAVAHTYLDDMLDSDLDTLILGCTHYPVLKETLQNVVSSSVGLITSGAAVAGQVRAYLEQNQLKNSNSARIEKFYVTDLPQQFDTLGSRFLGRQLTNVKYLDSF